MQGCLEPISQPLGAIRVKPVHVQNAHLLPQYTRNNDASNVNKSRNVRRPFLSSQNSMNTGFLNTNLTRIYPQWRLWDCAKTCMTASALSLSLERLFLPHRSFNISCTVPSTSNLSRILVTVTLVGMVYQIQLSNVVELQQYSPLTNTTSAITYVHRMIISPPFLFKHMKNDDVLLCFSSDFWIIQKIVLLSNFVAEK